MSLLERLGRKTDNEELTKQVLNKELEGAQNGATRHIGGLTARLKANHGGELQNNAVDADSSMVAAERLEGRKIDHDVDLLSRTNVRLGEESRLETTSEDKLSQSSVDLKSIGQNLGLTSHLANKPNNSNLGAGLSSRLGIASKSEISFLHKNTSSQPILELAPKLGKSIDNESIISDKKENLIAANKELIKEIDVSNKKSVDVEATRGTAKNIIENKTVSGGLGAKLGLGAKVGLGARLGKDDEQPNNVASGASKSVLNSKITVAQPATSEQSKYQNLKIEIHRQIIEELSIEQQKIIANSSSDRSELERIVVELCNKVIDGENPTAMSRAARTNIVNDIVDEVLGLGPVEALLKDETVSEVMINGAKMVYVERKGKLTLTNVQFQNEEHLMNIIERIVAPLGRRIDESSPLVDARLADGSRVNIIIPPLALNGACVTIRKFATDPLTINNLIGFGSLNEDMASLIKSCVLGRLNIVVSGGTGSGKTTTLNVLSSFIPEDERIVTIEDAAELQLRQDHVVTLESRPANVEGNGQVSIRDLVRNSLRMRPDRIVVGECRSGEALDMLQAMNTGHDGSLTTAHANSPRDVISRLETMVLMAGMELPVKAIREQIASAVDLIIQQSRLRDGSRKITYITEVQGMEGEVIVLQDLFRFEQDGLDEDGKLRGEFRTSGIRPKFLEKLETNGIKVDCDMFLGHRGWGE